MRVIVTGSESFIGSRLKHHCRLAGVEHVGIDLAPSEDPNHHQADICSDTIVDAIPGNADALIHLAAVSTDQTCRMDTKKAFEVNVGGTINLIEAARARGVKQFVFASTEWVYGEVANSAVQTEESPIDAMRLSSEYAISKITGERLLYAAHKRDGLAVTVLRFGIVYGPRPANWSAVEALFHAVRTKDTVEVGSLETGRRFIHVADIADGILGALGRNGYELFNLSGDRLITLGNIIEESSSLVGRHPRVIEKNSGAISIRNPDNGRARRVMGWRPKIALKDGLSTLL
jgi:nucleoside-diphosphate-sugar epimerase